MTIVIWMTLHGKTHTIVEVLYEVERLSIEWIILELAFIYDYKDTISSIEILKHWDGELQSRIITESNGLCDESSRDDNRVLSEYNNFEVAYPEPIPE